MSTNQAVLNLGIPSQTLNARVRQSERIGLPAFIRRGVQTLTEQERRIKSLERNVASSLPKTVADVALNFKRATL